MAASYQIIFSIFMPIWGEILVEFYFDSLQLLEL